MNKKIRYILIPIIVALIIEIFVCNVHYFMLLLNNDAQKNVEVEYLNIDNGNSPYIKIGNINQKVYNIKIKVNEKYEDIYTFDVRTYSNDLPNHNIVKETQKTVNTDYKKEHIIKINSTYDIDNIYIYVTNSRIRLIQNIDVKLDSITLNVNSFNFNIVRFLVLIGIIWIILAFKNKNNKVLVNTKDIANSKSFEIMFCIVALLVSIYTCSDCIFNPDFFYIDTELLEDVEKTGRTVIYNIYRQCDAFLSGSLDIEIDTSKLGELDNPYDITQREMADVDYLFDIAYYNGRYYQYFSVLINLLLIIPFRIVTGRYFDGTIYAALLLLIGIIIFSVFYKELISKYIKKVSKLNFYLGYYTLLICTGFLYYNRGLIYDMQILLGQIFFMLSIIIILKLEKSKKIRYGLYILLGIFTSFIVVSKANMIFYYIPITYLYFKMLKDKKYKKKQIIKILIATFTLFIAIAILQMWYNYIRFESIFEFGTNYQLTVADMRYATNISLNRFIDGIISSLFTIPRIDLLEFPFINEGDPGIEKLIMNEYIYKHYTIGILCVPVILLIFFKNNLNKNDDNKNINMLINMFNISAILINFFNILFAGVSDRYMIDIRLLLIISVILLFFKLFENSNNELLNKTFILASTISIILMLPIMFAYENSGFKIIDLAYIKNIIMFWI